MAYAISGGTEFTVNTQTIGAQVQPSVAFLGNGDFVVTWHDINQALGDESGSSVKAQVFDADGMKKGGEIVVNTTTAGNQAGAEVTALSWSGFVVTWTDTDPVTNRSDIKAQRYDNNAAKVGTEFLVNTSTQGDQGDAEVTFLNNGGFAVTWYDSWYAGGGSIKLQVYDANSAKVGGEILVQAPGNTQYAPAVTALDWGGFVVTWYGNPPGEGSYAPEIKVQIFDWTGAKAGGEIIVNSEPAGDQVNPVVTALRGGNFVVIWQDHNGGHGDNSGSAILGQVFDYSGSKLGEEFRVNTETDDLQWFPAITALEDGSFVVTWTDSSETGADTDGSGIKAQAFDASGLKVGGEFLVNTSTASVQTSAAIAADGNSLVIAWTDYSGVGDSSEGGIRAKVFDLVSYASAGDDILNGTWGDDSIDGLGGGDTLSGLGGEDTLIGGAGNDYIDGGDDDDTLSGGDGNDLIVDYGGGGNFSGGGGDDNISAQVWPAASHTFVIDGGAGDDRINVRASGDLSGQVSGGDGNDKISVWAGWYTAMVISGGEGRDLFSFDFNAGLSGSTGLMTVIDFEAGDGGDLLMFDATWPGWSYPIGLLKNYDDTNPFGTGHLRLEQYFGDTLLQIDLDGAGTEYGYNSFAVLEGVTASEMTADNFGGYDPDGTAPVGIALNGTEDKDSLVGTLGGDTLDGLGGDDYVFGSDGRDSLSGGAGDDYLQGSFGNDTLNGGDGDDELYDDSGDNLIFGGAGNDSIRTNIGFSERLAVTGGDGNDTVSSYAYRGTIDGGAGDDVIDVYALTVPGGDGVRLTGGDGRDTFKLRDFLTVTDFTAGDSGDIIDVAHIRLMYGLSSTGNPFETGQLRLVQQGDDTLLQVDQTGFAFHNLVVLMDVQASSLTAANFSGFAPGTTADSHGTSGADTMTGTLSDDVLFGEGGNDLITGGDGGSDAMYGGDGHDTATGGWGDDTLDGGEGSDSLNGAQGDDLLLGGARWDTLVGSTGADTLDGGTGNDAMYGGWGNDTYFVDHVGDRVYEDAYSGDGYALYATDTVRTSIDYALTPNVENLILTHGALSGTGNGLSNSIEGTSGNNTLIGGLGNDSLYGWDGSDSLTGGNDHDRLSGGNGADTLIGGHGNDVLGGGAGADRFIFSSVSVNGHDHIVDFEHDLDALVFTGSDYGFASGHVLTAAQFTAGSVAVGAGAQFVWDAAASKLWWDADGAGAGAAFEIALISGGAAVTRDDLLFI